MHVCVNTYSQTIEHESAQITKSYQNGDFSQSEFAGIAKKWNALLDEIGGYPELPYDDKIGLVQFEFIKDLNGLNRAIIFDRVKEWAAINFSHMDAAFRYENLESGKIILKGSFEIPVLYEYKNFWGNEKEDIREGTCYQTYIFTIKDDKIKIQITNLSYEVRMSYYSSSTNTYTKATKIYSINEICPIILKDPLRWKEYLTMIKFTKDRIVVLVNSLESYEKNFIRIINSNNRAY